MEKLEKDRGERGPPKTPRPLIENQMGPSALLSGSGRKGRD